MKLEPGTLRKFKFTDKTDIEVEGRIFFRNVVYEAKYQLWDPDTLSVVFCGENGCFNFEADLFEEVIKEWKLEEVTE